MKTMMELLAEFLGHCRALNYSQRTLDDYEVQIRSFGKWLEESRGVTTADRMVRQHLEAWLHHLRAHRTRKGLPLKIKTVRLRIAVLRSFLKYLAKQAYIPVLLPDMLVSPKDEEMLPTSVLHHDQMKKLLASVDTTTPLGHRDRAMLEMLYTTGARASELVNLNVEDIDFDAGNAKLDGKGRKQRVVPIGKTALRFLTSYMVALRPFMMTDDPAETALFLSRSGSRLTTAGLRRMVHLWADKLGFGVPVACHTFRRTAATELIRSGANAYHVKELLGHESLDMLKPYTKLTIMDLKKTHERTHPRERDEE